MGAKSFAESFKFGLQLGQRRRESDRDFNLRKERLGLEEERYEESDRRYEEEKQRREKWRREDLDIAATRRAEDKAQKDKEYKEDVRQYNEEQKIRGSEESRRKVRFGREQREYKKKKRFDVIKTKINTAKALVDAGDHRQAAKMVMDMYNDEYPDDDESRIIFKEDNPDDEIWKKYDDHEMLVISKKQGVLPIKRMQDLLEVMASTVDYKEFSKDDDALEARVSAKNDAEKPFRAQDGKFYIQKWKRGKGGMPEKDGDPMPYVGPTAMGKDLERAAAVGLENLSVKDREILIKMREQKKEPTPKDSKGAFDAQKAETEVMIKDLTLLLKPFAKSGTMLLISDSGDLTKAGQTALDAASDLWQKQKDKPKSMSPQEKRKVNQAKELLQTYEVMRQRIQSKYSRQGGAGGKQSWKDYMN